MRHEDSGELLRRHGSGDRLALETLLRQHYPSVRAFVRVRMSALLRAHESAEDLVQSACRELLGKLDGFEYQGEEAFRAWLFTGVLHKLRHRERDLRAQKRDARREAREADAASLAECYASALSPSQQMVAEEQVRALEAAFDSLPEHYREVISLSRLARLSRARVAAVMGRTEDAIRNLLPRALVALASALERGKAAGDC